MICPNCKSKGENIQAVNGKMVCLDCMIVVSHEVLEQGVEFVGNTTKIVGMRMPVHGLEQRVVPGGASAFSGSSIQQKYCKFYKIMSEIALKLNISKEIRDLGHRYHKIASLTKIAENGKQKSLTQGRNTYVVAAACLYMACRIKKSPYLLIDFQDAIHVNMFKIADQFKIFCNKILLPAHEIPFIDPSLFIERFCDKLEFGDKLQQVRDTAIRLIQSMNRSWMTVGRRPNGLCGAAILISAKINGFRRSPAQVVKAVHACEETIRKRVNEFKFTNTAMLTRGQLKEIEAKE